MKSFLNKLISPTSKVHDKYHQYIKWSLASTFIVSIESVIATNSMFSSIGETSSSSLLTFNYIGKDIIGQLGGLIYISSSGKYIDENPLSSLYYSNSLQQSSFLLMASTHFIPNFFLPLAGLSSLAMNISFSFSGAVNAKCINALSFSKRDKDNNTTSNIGELYARISALNTLGSSIGMVTGLSIIFCLKDCSPLLLPFLGILRIYTLKKAVDTLI